MANPFILYEFDFDAELFKKYYGSIENPGVYAIPEDDVDPSASEEAPSTNDSSAAAPTDGDGSTNPDDDISQSDQALKNKMAIQNQLAHTAGLEPIQMSPEEQAAYDKEVEPIKKIFLLNKLSQLANILRTNFSADSNLEIILKFGINLSYKTLQILAVNTINHLRDLAQERERQEVSGDNNNVQTQQEVQLHQ